MSTRRGLSRNGYEMLEENSITSMIKADGNMLALFSCPIAATLVVVTILVQVSPVLLTLLRRGRAQTA